MPLATTQFHLVATYAWPGEDPVPFSGYLRMARGGPSAPCHDPIPGLERVSLSLPLLTAPSLGQCFPSGRYC